MGVELTTRRSFRWIHLVDVTLIACACWTVFNFAQPSWKWPTLPAKQAPFLAFGQRLTLPGVDWRNKPRHVVLAFTTSCQYCVRSGPFYKRVSDWVAAHPNEQFIIVSPEPTLEIEEWMKGRGVVHFRHVEANFHLHGFRVTPTMVFVDAKGAVTDVAVGLLSDEEQAQVFSRLDQAGPPLAIRFAAQASAERRP